MANVLEAEYAATVIAPDGCRSISYEQEAFVGTVACEVIADDPGDPAPMRIFAQTKI